MAIELPAPPPPTRDIYTNRTLNLRAIRAIGYDMDYTLVHYHVDVWERRAFEYARDRMVESGLPVGHLEFDDQLVERGLIIDTHAGNVVKADRFGYVKAAAHGTAPLPFVELRELYGRLFVDLRDERWVFMSTLFDLSLAGLYSQCVDLLDAGRLPGVMGYRDLFARVRRGLDSAHIEGALKAEIMQDPASYVDLDPDGPRALLDQKDAGKKLLLITNSEWVFTDAMMRFAYERFLPAGMRWRDLFHMVIIQARKPSFFTDSNPIFEVINDQGHLRPLVGLPQAGGVYLGGHAGLVEQALGLSGLDFLYVGDHIFSDVNVSKSTVRWRTALVLRELEREIEAAHDFHADEVELGARMAEKSTLEQQLAQLRLLRQRRKHRRPGAVDAPQGQIDAEHERIKQALAQLDTEIAPLAERASRVQGRWGPVMRAGIDKSHMARQIERYADVYTSRVSNFLFATPHVYLRPPKSSLPHDP
ncbi:MAG: HAD family hydrolase [Deltaproteobacteria bacterium HGW-Deltaproteobacteria-14]|jgi:HAD superfamily 5'-nucleotidase-like hydrolase|nr:MAG: HAD family hydrolase [Deltaproteobacteria bacterium HGW-Deltaproteobacteria-14]